MLFWGKSIILMYAVVGTNSLIFRLPANTRKCLKEEIPAGVVVTGKYDLSYDPGQTVDLLITNTKGHVLIKRENIDKGKFSFVAVDHAVESCFTSKLSAGQTGKDIDVMLTIKHGVEAKSYDKNAEEEERCRLETNRPNCGLRAVESKKKKNRRVYQEL